MSYVYCLALSDVRIQLLSLSLGLCLRDIVRHGISVSDLRVAEPAISQEFSATRR